MPARGAVFQDDGSARAARAPSLDIKGTNSISEWTDKQKRVRRATSDRLGYWQGRGYQCLWVTLSSSPDSPKRLRDSFEELRVRVRRQLKFKFEYVCVETSEGHGVLHMIWAWKDPRRGRRASFFIPQDWLASTWLSIHGAHQVWVARIGRSAGDRRRLSRYIVSQYCGGQAALVRVSQSRLAVSLVALRRMLVRSLRDCDERARNGGLLYAVCRRADGSVDFRELGQLMNEWFFIQYRRAWSELLEKSSCLAFGVRWVFFAGRLEAL